MRTKQSSNQLILNQNQQKNSIKERLSSIKMSHQAMAIYQRGTSQRNMFTTISFQAGKICQRIKIIIKNTLKIDKNSNLHAFTCIILQYIFKTQSELSKQIIDILKEIQSDLPLIKDYFFSQKFSNQEMLQIFAVMLYKIPDLLQKQLTINQIIQSFPSYMDLMAFFLRCFLANIKFKNAQNNLQRLSTIQVYATLCQYFNISFVVNKNIYLFPEIQMFIATPDDQEFIFGKYQDSLEGINQTQSKIKKSPLQCLQIKDLKRSLKLNQSFSLDETENEESSPLVIGEIRLGNICKIQAPPLVSDEVKQIKVFQQINTQTKFQSQLSQTLSSENPNFKKIMKINHSSKIYNCQQKNQEYSNQNLNKSDSITNKKTTNLTLKQSVQFTNYNKKLNNEQQFYINVGFGKNNFDNFFKKCSNYHQPMSRNNSPRSFDFNNLKIKSWDTINQRNQTRKTSEQYYANNEQNSRRKKLRTDYDDKQISRIDDDLNRIIKSDSYIITKLNQELLEQSKIYQELKNSKDNNGQKIQQNQKINNIQNSNYTRSQSQLLFKGQLHRIKQKCNAKQICKTNDSNKHFHSIGTSPESIHFINRYFARESKKNSTNVKNMSLEYKSLKNSQKCVKNFKNVQKNIHQNVSGLAELSKIQNQIKLKKQSILSKISNCSKYKLTKFTHREQNQSKKMTNVPSFLKNKYKSPQKSKEYCQSKNQIEKRESYENKSDELLQRKTKIKQIWKTHNIKQNFEETSVNDVIASDQKISKQLQISTPFFSQVKCIN